MCRPNGLLISCKRPERTNVPCRFKERRRHRSLGPPAFVGCISGLGGAATRPLTLHLTRFEKHPDNDTDQRDSNGETKVAQVQLADRLAFIRPLPCIEEVPETPEPALRCAYVPRIVPPRQG